MRARLTTINTPYEMYYGDSLSLVDRICYERTEVAALLWRINIVALEENRSDSSGEKSPNEPNKPKLSCRDMFKMATTHISYWHRYLNKYISNPDDQLEQSELPPKMTVSFPDPKNTQKRSSFLGANALLKLPDKKARSQDHSFEVPKGSSRQIADQSSNGPRSNPNEPAQQPQKESPYSKAQTLHRSSSPMISQQVEPMRKLSVNFLFEEFFYYLSNFSTLRGLWEARQGNKWIAEKHLLNSVMITNKFDYSIVAE